MEQIIRQKVAKLILGYGVLAAIIISPYLYISERRSLESISIMIFGIISIVFFFLMKKHYWTGYVIIILVLLMFVLAPMVFIQNGGIYGGATLWVATGIILFFIFMHGNNLLALCISYLFTYFYILSYIFRDGVVIVQLNNRLTLFLDMFISLIATSLLIYAISCCQYEMFAKERVESTADRTALKSASTAKSRFLSSITVEIRIPLNFIINMTEVVMKEDLDKATREEIDTIRESSYALLTIVDNVLTYSRLEAGKFRLLNSEFDFVMMIKELLDTMAVEAYKKKITMTVHLDKDIPTTILGDEVYVKQIYQYLMSIAIDNTGMGRILLDIKCERSEDKKTVKISTRIADTGNGLSKIDVQYLFGTYSVYDSRQSSNLKGIGLKYSICKQLLNLMKGDISVESIEGIGMATDFTFYVEVNDDKPAFELTKDEEINILVYIADEHMQQFWTEMLKDFPVQIKFCSNYLHLDKILFEKYYQYIFLPYEIYEQSINTISKYGCKNYTYIIGEYYHTMDDFDGCKMIRRPISCINIIDVINGTWTEDEYLRKMKKRDFHAPKANILITDDNTVNLKLISNLFQKYQIDIALATSGEECLKKVKENRYHMVFIDSLLPDMNGINLMEQIRSLKDDFYRKLPLIMITPSKEISVRDEYIQAGFNDFIVKPVRAADLERCMLELLPPDIIEEYNAVDTETTNSTNKPGNVKIESGLDTAKGLLNIGFNEDAYHAILNTYYKECNKNLGLLPELKANTDLSLYTTYVHGMKSSSASIGAMEVSELFKQMEFAGKENNRSFIEENYEAYTEKLREMLEIVKQYLIDHQAFQSDDVVNDNESKEQIDMNSELINELKECMDKMNLKRCDELIAELSDYNYGKEINSIIQQMKEAYNNFDFHNAKIQLNKLLEI